MNWAGGRIPLLLTSEVGGEGCDHLHRMALASGPDVQSAQVPTFSVEAVGLTISEVS
jgi:hypothetical protein